MENKYEIFISYSRRDSEIADRICNVLDSFGISYFIDRRGISGGMEFPEKLAYAIVNSKIFLFLASKNSYSSGYTNKEITFAFNHKCKMLPYIIDGSNLPMKFEITFADINWLNIKDHPIESCLINDLLHLLGKTPGPKALSRKERESYALKCIDKGFQYYKGDGVEINRPEAVKCFRMAAESGNSSAQLYLGLCYEMGDGDKIEANQSKAVRWYRKAAESGHPIAQLYLGECYENGNGTKTDLSEAVKWYKKAAENGCGIAKAILSIK